MKKIPLTQGYFAEVSDDWYEYLVQWKWRLKSGSNNNVLYAVTGDCVKEKGQKVVLMHRLIMNCPENMNVDHIDGDGLNNQKSNLRICNTSQNTANQKKRKNTTSLFKGVCWHKRDNVWRAKLVKNNLKVLDKGFRDEVEAAKAYDNAALEHFGEFAVLNFPENAVKRAGF